MAKFLSSFVDTNQWLEYSLIVNWLTKMGLGKQSDDFDQEPNRNQVVVSWVYTIPLRNRVIFFL